jgi:hypothetical protein
LPAVTTPPARNGAFRPASISGVIGSANATAGLMLEALSG